MEQTPADADARAARRPFGLCAERRRHGNHLVAETPATTEYLSREPARACQSLAHHTTLTGRCRKSVDIWAPLSEESQSCSTTTIPIPAECLGNNGNSATLAAVHLRRQEQTTPVRESTRDPVTICSKEQAPPSTAWAHPQDADRNLSSPTLASRLWRGPKTDSTYTDCRHRLGHRRPEGG
eukprot:scaffold12691_cov108-Isochrysis_galbana.AAC.15